MKRFPHVTRWLPVLALVMATTGCGYNQIQTLDERTSQAKNQISVQLQRRSDLIPNLVAVVQGFATHETEVFTAIAEARSKLGGAVTSGDLGQMSAASQQMNGALGRLLAISEIALGSALLLPVIPAGLAGAGLTAFSACLLGLYARTPGMRKERSPFPTERGITLAKDVWMLGIGLGLVIDAATPAATPRREE